MPGGRPTTYPKDREDELCAAVVEYGKQGMSEVEIAVELEQPRTTIRSWADQYPAFSSALMRAKNASQAWWERAARQGTVGSQSGQINPVAWKHTVACRFRDDYAERKDVNVEGSLTINVVDRFGEDAEE